MDIRKLGLVLNLGNGGIIHHPFTILPSILSSFGSNLETGPPQQPMHRRLGAVVAEGEDADA